MACNKMTEDKRWLHPRNKLRFLLFGCSLETVRTTLVLDQQNLPRLSDGESTREQSAAEAAQAIGHAKVFAEASIAGARNCSNGRQTRNSKPRNFGTTSGEPMLAKVPDLGEMLVSGSSANSPCCLVASLVSGFLDLLLSKQHPQPHRCSILSSGLRESKQLLTPAPTARHPAEA